MPDLPEDDSEIEEVRRGYVPSGQKQRFEKASLAELVDPRFGDAAAPGLILPFMRGDEAIRLLGMTSGGEIVIRLPGHRPRFQVKRAGKMLDLSPVINRVVVSTEEMGLYIVWHAGFAPPYPLPDCMPPDGEEGPPAGWDLGGIEAFVDGQPVPALS